MSEIDQSAGEIEEVAARVPLQGDLTQGPILKTMLAFSVPMLIGNVIQTLNGSINAIWVGRLIGEDALAATTNANAVTFLLFALTFGFGTATTVRIGQHFGARDIDAARRSFGAGLGFTVALSLLLSAAGWIAAPALLQLLATPAGSFELALAYLRVIFLSIPFGTVNMLLGMGLRGAGDSRSPMVATAITVALDVVLNPLFIAGGGPLPPLGIAGSALASFFAGLGGVSFLLWQLYARDKPLRLRGRELAYLVPARPELRYVMAKGMPMGAQMVLVSSAQMVMIGLVNREGVDATAAFGVSMQLWNYLQMPAFAISMAVSAMVAQNIGAGHHERVGAVTRAGMISNLALTGVLTVVLVLAAGPLAVLFLGGGSPAIPAVRHIQLIVTWSFVVAGAAMVAGGTMRSYGVVWWPLLFQAIAIYPVRLGFYFAMYPRLGADALWWSFPLASCVSALSTWWLYTRGAWREQRHLAYASA